MSWTSLKNGIATVIKTNGNQEITGNALQGVLNSMVNALGAHATLAGIAIPSTSPGTPDGPVFYLAFQEGSYSNFGVTPFVVSEGEFGIFIWDGTTWSTLKYTPGVDLSEIVSDIEHINLEISQKLNKVVGTNLIDPNNLLIGATLPWNSTTGRPETGKASNYKVSDYIPVDGKDIIAKAYYANNTWASMFVYDANKNFLRIVGATTQYTYQEGDAYVRISFNSNVNTDLRANYGTTLLPYEDYTDYKPVADLQKEMPFAVQMAEQIPNKLDKVYSSNIYDKSKAVTKKYINPNGVIVTAGLDAFGVSDYIPVNGQNIISNTTTSSASIGSYNVYDKGKNLLRTIIQNDQYTYQEGDYYVRICFNNYDVGHANYGTTLLPYEDYTEYKPLTDLKKEVESFSSAVEQIPNKLDKKYGNNLVNPDDLLVGAALPWNSTTGRPNTGFTDSYLVTGYIPVDGKNIIAAAYSSSGTWTTMFIYDADKNFLRTNGTSTQYTYQEGDAYVRISLRSNDIRANYGNTLLPYEDFTDYKPLDDLKKRVDALDGGEKSDLSLVQMNKLYLCYNSVVPTRNYVVNLWLTHFLRSADYINKDIFFDNRQRYMPFYPISTSTKSETTTTVDIKPKEAYNDTQLSFKTRFVNNAPSKSVTPRILTIGDSVTNGYGASANKKVSWMPNHYWAFAKMFFEMDKIDGGDNANEYNAIFLGCVNGSFTINYNGVSRAVSAHAESKGGAQLNELFTSTWGGTGSTTPNPFYDATNQTFSIADYIRRFRTMDDLGVRLVSQSSNPAGESVVGSDGLTYTIGTSINTQSKLNTYEVCTPTHIIINLVHNTSTSDYSSNIGNVINIIKTELPNAKIVLMVIDQTGTYFPIDYPDYIASQITYTSLHTKNLNIYKYILDNVEDENNNVFLLGANFIQPTAKGHATIKYDDAAYAERGEQNVGLNITDPSVEGASYHPNNYTHEAFGYALYSMLKYLITT